MKIAIRFGFTFSVDPPKKEEKRILKKVDRAARLAGERPEQWADDMLQMAERITIPQN